MRLLQVSKGMYLKNALKNKYSLCSTVDKIPPLQSEDASCQMLAVAAIPKHRCMHNIPWLDSNLPRMVDKLQSIIDEIKTHYEKLTE